jgi:hypothetical protein
MLEGCRGTGLLDELFGGFFLGVAGAGEIRLMATSRFIRVS